jgi:predicted  nucleic acid-binding Zn-ribbon protein
MTVVISTSAPFGPHPEDYVSQSATLYRLQMLDSEAEAKQHRLSEIEASLGQTTEVRQTLEAFERVETNLRALKTKARDLELGIATIGEKAAHVEKKLYSGGRANPKELRDMQGQVAALQRRHKALEEELLAAMIAVEEAQEHVAEAQASMEAAQARHAASQSDLGEEQAALQARLEELEAERESECARLKPGHLQLYTRLRQSRGGVAVARVEDGACGACGTQPSSAIIQRARHGEIIQCPNCSRVLYAP